MDNENQTKTFQTETGPRTLHVGGTVRVLGVPPDWYKNVAPNEYDETTTVLGRCVGRVYPVLRIDEYEHIWIGCLDDGTPCDDANTSIIWPLHTFAVELLEIVDYGGE